MHLGTGGFYDVRDGCGMRDVLPGEHAHTLRRLDKENNTQDAKTTVDTMRREDISRNKVACESTIRNEHNKERKLKYSISNRPDSRVKTPSMTPMLRYILPFKLQF
jgi:hypothetical protein